MGSNFNQSVSSLPLSFESLYLGFYFSPSLSNLPLNLRVLSVAAHNYNAELAESLDNLPSTLVELDMRGMKTENFSFRSFPLSLKQLKLPYSYNTNLARLPPTLEYLSTGSEFNQRISFLPQTLLNLELGAAFTQPLPELPPKLKYLSFGCGGWNGSIEKYPSTSTELRLSDEYTRTLDNPPDSLLVLWIGRRFNQTIMKLPQNLIDLHFDSYSRFNQEIDHALPKTLKTLHLGAYFEGIYSTFQNHSMKYCYPMGIHKKKCEKFQAESML